MALLCAAGVPLPLAAVTSQSFLVSATVTAGCLVVGGVSNYGSLNYGSQSALATGTVRVALTGDVQLQCTPGVSVSMQVNGGLNNVSGRHLKMGSGTAQIAYQLFQDAARTQSLGIAQSVNVPYTNANAISLPIYGYVVLPGNQPAGTYSDTLQVQISY